MSSKSWRVFMPENYGFYTPSSISRPEPQYGISKSSKNNYSLMSASALWIDEEECVSQELSSSSDGQSDATMLQYVSKQLQSPVARKKRWLPKRRASEPSTLDLGNPANPSLSRRSSGASERKLSIGALRQSILHGGKLNFGEGADLRRMAIAIGVGLLIALSPCPSGLEPRAWNLFAVFIGTIVGIMLTPLPLGAVGMIGLTVSMATKVLTFEQAFSGFGTLVPWLTAMAFFLSRGMIKSGLGRRLSYHLIQRIGSSTLGLVYSLVLAEVIIAPCIPSITARVGGIIKPLIEGVAVSMGSLDTDEASKRKVGTFLVVTLFQTSCVSSAMFLTGTSANPLAAAIAEQSNVEITWELWAKGAILPGGLCILLIPMMMYKILPPTIKASPEAPAEAARQLKKMGPLSMPEAIVGCTLGLTVLLWMLDKQIGVNSVTAAGIGLTILLVTGLVTWKEMLAEGPAWDTMFWFAALISLANNLKAFGFIDWMSSGVVAAMTHFNISGVGALVFVSLIFFYTHYLFASGAAHVGAMYGALLTVAIQASAPDVATALLLAYIGSLNGAVTNYGVGSGPPLFMMNYVSTKTWMVTGLITSVVTLGVFLGIGVPWMKFMGIM